MVPLTKTVESVQGSVQVPLFEKVHWLDYTNKGGVTPIGMAVEHGHLELAACMIRARPTDKVSFCIANAVDEVFRSDTAVVPQSPGGTISLLGLSNPPGGRKLTSLLQTHVDAHGLAQLYVLSKQVLTRVSAPSPTEGGVLRTQIEADLKQAVLNEKALITDERPSLATVLRPVKQFLECYVQWPVYFAGPGERSIPDALRRLLLEPAIECIRRELRTKVAAAARDPQGMLAEIKALAESDSRIYDAQLKKTLRIEGWSEFDKMVAVLKRVEGAVDQRSTPTQPCSDPLDLTALTRDATPPFKRVVDSMVESLKGAGFALAVKHRPVPKSVYRVAEKCLLKKPGFSLDRPIDCTDLLDMAGCLIECETLAGIAVVVNKINEFGWTVCRFKSTWTGTSKAGWRDCKVSVRYAENVIFEIQVALSGMLTARSELKGHAAYSKFRNISECLRYVGDYDKDLVVATGSKQLERNPLAGRGESTKKDPLEAAKDTIATLQTENIHHREEIEGLTTKLNGLMDSLSV